MRPVHSRRTRRGYHRGMPLRVLLHVLLIFTLAFNGMGAAMARVASLEAAPSTQDAAPPCHGVADAVPASDDATHASGTQALVPDHACGGADCRCACLHAATLPMPAPLPPAALVLTIEPAPARRDTRPPPALALHLRPPIRTA